MAAIKMQKIVKSQFVELLESYSIKEEHVKPSSYLLTLQFEKLNITIKDQE